MSLPIIAVLNPISKLGGAEISLLELLSRSKQHFQFHLIIPENGPLRKKAEEAGIKVWEVRWPEKIMRLGERTKKSSPFEILHAALSLPGLVKRVSRLLSNIGAEVLITNGIKSHIIGALTTKRHTAPLIWYFRDGLEGRGMSIRFLGFLSSRCSMVLSISHYIAAEAHKYLSSSIPVRVLYNIVDLEKFKPALTPPPDLKKGEKEIWFGTIGATTPLKGQDLFLDAAVQVLNVIPNSRYIIVGENFYKTEKSLNYDRELRLRSQSFPLKNRVEFLGFRNDIPQILSLLDVLVQPNRGPEGLGRSILEAMACGVPVISVNRWGPAEIVKDRYTGLLFHPCDVDGLSGKMIALGKDAEFRKKMGNNGVKWVRENICPDNLVNEFRAILEGFISREGGDIAV